jgi:hypothetical protein
MVFGKQHFIAVHMFLPNVHNVMAVRRCLCRRQQPIVRLSSASEIDEFHSITGIKTGEKSPAHGNIARHRMGCIKQLTSIADCALWAADPINNWN